MQRLVEMCFSSTQMFCNSLIDYFRFQKILFILLVIYVYVHLRLAVSEELKEDIK